MCTYGKKFVACVTDIINFNLSSVSNICEAVPRSLFWAPNRFNELLEVRFKFPFILIGKLIMAFLTGQS